MLFSPLLLASAVHAQDGDTLSLLQTRASASHGDMALTSKPGNIDDPCVDLSCDLERWGSWFTVKGKKYRSSAWPPLQACVDANGITIPDCWTIMCSGDGDFHMRNNMGCMNEKHWSDGWPAEQKQECVNRHNHNPADWQPWGLTRWAQSSDKKVVIHMYHCAHYCTPSNPHYVGDDGVNICPMQGSMTMVGVKAGSQTITWGTSRDTDPDRSKHLTDDWVRINDEVIRPVHQDSGFETTTRSVLDADLGEVLVVIRGWTIKVSGGNNKNFFMVESVMNNAMVSSLTSFMQDPWLDDDANGATICTNVWDMDSGPNPGQSTGSPVLITPGSTDELLIFNQGEIDSRCTACVWGRLAQMRQKNGALMVDQKWSHQGTVFPATLDECLAFEKYPGSCDAYYNPRTCENPSIPGEPRPTAEDKCTETECSFSFATRLCAPLKGTPPEDKAYDNCLWDFCATCDEKVYEEYEEIENFEHPEPTCLENAGNCNGVAACENAMTMDISDGPSQNNLGGFGPDDGADELRFSRAGSYNGKFVDLVVTSEGYKPKKPEVTGARGKFGNINLKCGSNSAFTFSWVDSDTGEPIEVSDVSVSFFDMDEGKKGKGRNKVTACGASDLFVSKDTELTTAKRSDGCFSAESSAHGQKNNEPQNPLLLTQDHMSRAASFTFKDSSSASFDVTMTQCKGARNLQFAVTPTVVCAGV